ncbi:hypothetical protein Gobs01_05038 [Geodermatophilus obscurus DSM 43160]|uniref:Uncharacterized protein n=1 Tax=Geodermatophilus obscurus (strain ATCC 25078 / DSM 43160 / JCM 3152 / CCUG 61914 / KCC A-0152 / KCTC 9177 / NBRC 13315 / NRRL B-3577 / G-20) TaxID=526225 RepID=D2S7S4_GEOOG|nr:hypothetical protein Gobs_2915 [Geodermatophilus obscurus DSM 43160]
MFRKTVTTRLDEAGLSTGQIALTLPVTLTGADRDPEGSRSAVARPNVTGFLRLQRTVVPGRSGLRAADPRCCSPDWTRTNNPAI